MLQQGFSGAHMGSSRRGFWLPISPLWRCSLYPSRALLRAERGRSPIPPWLPISLLPDFLTARESPYRAQLEGRRIHEPSSGQKFRTTEGDHVRHRT